MDKAILLKSIDPTQRKLDTILREPLQTGISLARQAMSVQVTNSKDSRLRSRQFGASLQSLEKAYSYASSRQLSEECVRIRWAQAAIAKAMGASGVVAMYLTAHSRTLNEEIAQAESQLRSSRAELRKKEAQLTDEGREGWARIKEHLKSFDPMEVYLETKVYSPQELSDWEKYRIIFAKDSSDAIKTLRGVEFWDMDVRKVEFQLKKLQAFAKFWQIRSIGAELVNEKRSSDGRSPKR